MFGECCLFCVGGYLQIHVEVSLMSILILFFEAWWRQNVVASFCKSLQGLLTFDPKLEVVFGFGKAYRNPCSGQFTVHPYSGLNTFNAWN